VLLFMMSVKQWSIMMVRNEIVRSDEILDSFTQMSENH